MKRSGIKIIIGVIAGIILLYFMPFTVTNASDSDGRQWHVPFLCSVESVGDGEIVLSSIRSGYALGKDAENAMHSYEESKCYGMTYYYDEDNDVSFTGFTVRSSMPSEVIYTYETGNACAGWTLDQEIAWEDGDPLEVVETITPEEAIQNNWFVIQDGVALNMPQYYDFARMVKQGVFCMQRTLIFTGDQLEIVDVQLLESGRFLVTSVKDGLKETHEYGRFSEAEINGHKYACVFYGGLEDEPIPLYLCEE